MSEHLLTDDDYRSFDRTIGVEAALSINAIVTDTKMPYSELEAQNREGVLAPQLGSYLLRAEETADRHIGRRAENDTLFTSSGTIEEPLSLLEPYSKSREDALLSESQHAIRTENIARLQTSISDLVEPFYTGFLDKSPVLQEKPSRWRRNKAPDPITWSEQSPFDLALTHNFSLKPSADGIGLSEVNCKNVSQNSYENGVVATLGATDAHPTHLKLEWKLHMDYGDAPATIDKLAPGLLDQCGVLGVKKWEEYNGVHINFTEPALSIGATTFLSTANVRGDNVAYAYDADLDCFTANQPDLPAISTETYLHVTRQLLGFIPTTRVQ